MQDSKINSLTEGSIIKSIVFLSFPIIIGNLLQSAYQITDAFWVGRLGADAVAAVSISFPITFLIIAFTGGIGLAGGVLVSQYKGAKQQDKVDHVAGQTLLMAFFFSAIFSIIGYLFAPQIITLFGPEKAVFTNTVSYLRISFIGMVFIFGYLVYQSLARGVGDAKTPVYLILGTVILNFFLDPLFIFGYGFIPALGVGGAAMATAMTQATALIGGIIVFSGGRRGIHLKLKHFKPDFSLMKKTIFLGIPISLEQSSRSVGFIILTALATSFGTIALASYGIGTQMIGLVIIPALSLSIANSTLVGQNIGAGKIERAEKTAKTTTTIGFIVLTIIGILFFIFANQIIAAFIPNEPEVIREGGLFLKIVSLSFGFIGIQMSLLGALRGSGNTKTTLYIALIVMIVQIAVAIILSKFIFNNQLGIWIAFSAANIFGAFIAFFIFRKGKWKNKKLIEAKEVREII